MSPLRARIRADGRFALTSCSDLTRYGAPDIELLVCIPGEIANIMFLSCSLRIFLPVDSALDKSLHTTHGPARIFLIVAHYCNLSVYLDDLASLSARYRTTGFSFGLVGTYISAWWRYEVWSVSLKAAEIGMDTRARVEKWRLYWRGMRKNGLQGAWELQAGLIE